MEKVIIVLSAEADFEATDRTTDYWIMEGQISADAVDRYRKAGFSITSFNRIGGREQCLLDLLSMTMLHNSDWREIKIVK